MYICLSEAKASLRFKIWMTSGSKKGTQIHYLFLSKVLSNEPSPGSPKRPHIEREAHLQGILHISKKSHLSGSLVRTYQ
jgi:hypothetical protein